MKRKALKTQTRFEKIDCELFLYFAVLRTNESTYRYSLAVREACFREGVWHESNYVILFY